MWRRDFKDARVAHDVEQLRVVEHGGVVFNDQLVPSRPAMDGADSGLSEQLSSDRVPIDPAEILAKNGVNCFHALVPRAEEWDSL